MAERNSSYVKSTSAVTSCTTAASTIRLLQRLCAWKRRLGLQSTHFVSIRTSHNEHITGDTFATAF